MGIKGNNFSVQRFALTAFLIIALSHLPCFAQYSEDVVKAAYIERITRFVEWPVRENLPAAEQFVIGVYDEDEFYFTLTQVFKDKQIKELKVKIISLESPEQLSDCNLCYISGRAKSLLNKFVDKANTSGTLLFSETTGFCKAGVHVNFYIEDEKLKFEINESTMGSAGFKVSYLLKQNIRIIR
jgi:hypothetical protein